MRAFMSTQPENPELYRSSPKSSPQFALTARRIWLAYLPLGLVLLVLMLAAMLANYLGNQDLQEYQCYAGTFWYGARAFQSIPVSQCHFIANISQFHSLPLEYPPLALAVYSLPLLGRLADYSFGFTLMMALTVTLIYILLLKKGPGRAANFFTIGLLAGGLATSLTRFDIFPAALSLLCLILAARKHWTLAYVALALGALIKMYPIVLFPLLFLDEQRERASLFDLQAVTPGKTALSAISAALRNLRRWHWKNALVFAGTLAGVTAIAWGLSPSGAFHWLVYLAIRPFTAESTGAALLWLASLAGRPITWNFSFGSMNIISPISSPFIEGFVLLLAAGYLYIIIQQLRGKMDFLQSCLAALLLLIATGKVFSPQYLLWIIPFMALSAPGNRKLWLAWVGICILTTLIYPVFYGIIAFSQNGPYTPGFMPLIVLRDGLVVALTIAYLFNFLHLRSGNGEAISPSRPT
jgi:hypothetical protein